MVLRLGRRVLGGRSGGSLSKPRMLLTAQGRVALNDEDVFVDW